MKFSRLIQEICDEENIKWEILSHDYLIKLTKGNQVKFIWGHKFPLNDHGIGSIIDDKYALYEICKNKHIPIIVHQILWNPHKVAGKDTIELLKKYFALYHEDVVLKPNNGSEGIDVYHITNFKDLEKVSHDLFQKYFSLSICPYYNAKDEYRVIVLDNEVKLLYEKNKIVITGNGNDTVKDFLLKINPYYFQNKDLTKYDYVLAKGKTFLYDWRFNLSQGAIAKPISDKKLSKDIQNLALDVTKTIGARFVSVDIINVRGKLMVMEVNSGVCMNKVCHFIDKDYQKAKDIYRQAIKKMFA